MPKTKISEYSATNSSNTDIEGINIDEGCAPSGINNAIRELMVHLKEFQTGASGDAFTFAGGTLMSGTNTISGAAIISGNINSSGTNTFSGSNVMSFSGGSSASPSIYFASDTNTGIFSPAADTIAFAEGGAESMRIDSSGNVGIGVTPSAWGTASGQKAFQIGTGGFALSSNGSGAGDGSLTWNGYYNGTNWIYSYTGGAASRFRLNESGAAWFTAASGTAGNTISFTQAMTLDASGNLGIGTSSPGYKLDVSGRISYNGAIGEGASTTLSSSGTTVRLADSSTWQQIQFYTAGSERARITSGGEFLINATSAILSSRVLQAKRSGGGVAIFKVESGVGSEVLLLWNDATSGNNLFQEFGTENSIVIRGSIDYNRGAGLVRYNTSSDATLKNIIGDSDGAKSVEILNSTRIREFAWKDDPAQKPQIGVIAQELYETYKGAVSVGGNNEETIPAVTEQRLVSEAVLDENGNEIEAAVYETVEVEPERKETKYRPWGVDKTAFTFHLVAGWQAHEKLIKQQAETIAALEARIAALEAK